MTTGVDGGYEVGGDGWSTNDRARRDLKHSPIEMTRCGAPRRPPDLFVNKPMG